MLVHSWTRQRCRLQRPAPSCCLVLWSFSSRTLLLGKPHTLLPALSRTDTRFFCIILFNLVFSPLTGIHTCLALYQMSWWGSCGGKSYSCQFLCPTIISIWNCETKSLAELLFLKVVWSLLLGCVRDCPCECIILWNRSWLGYEHTNVSLCKPQCSRWVSNSDFSTLILRLRTF